jgi:hypothetical protein
LCPAGDDATFGVRKHVWLHAINGRIAVQREIHIMRIAHLSSAVAALAAGSIAAAGSGFSVSNESAVSFAGADLDGIVGSGIPNSNFVVAENTGENIEIGLKAIERFIGDLPVSGSTYTAQPGTSAGPPVGATWNYVLAADLGDRTIGDFDINLFVDFDPAAGVENFVTVDVDAQAALAGNSGASVFGDSQNLDFGFWSLLGAPAFDPFAAGEYVLAFEVLERGTSNVFARSEITVNVIPSPAAAPALGLLGLAAMRRRR